MVTYAQPDFIELFHEARTSEMKSLFAPRDVTGGWLHSHGVGHAETGVEQ